MQNAETVWPQKFQSLTDFFGILLGRVKLVNFLRISLVTLKMSMLNKTHHHINKTQTVTILPFPANCRPTVIIFSEIQNGKLKNSKTYHPTRQRVVNWRDQKLSHKHVEPFWNHHFGIWNSIGSAR